MSDLGLTRRDAIAGVLLTLVMVPSRSLAADDPIAAAIKDLVGDAAPQDGGISVRVPDLAENGAQVPVTITVDSPQTDASHVRAIHLVATKNPTPGIATFHLGPKTGRAQVTARIRLAESQTVIVLAQHNDGTVRRVTAEVRVTVGGCLT